MKSKSSFVIIYWWLLILLVFGLGLMLFAEKEERMSESEKRTLSGFPEVSVNSIFSGEFTSGLESYLSDGVFARDEIVGVSESVLRLFNAGTEEDAALLGDIEMDAQLQGTDVRPGETESEELSGQGDQQLPDNSTDESTDDSGDTDAAASGDDGSPVNGYGLWAVRTDGRYKQLHMITENQIANVAKAIDSFREFLPEDGFVFYTTVPLTHTGNIVCRSGQYTGWYENLKDCFEQYTGEGVYFINTPQLLEEDLMAGKHVFFNSDHHWTPYGAIKTVNECMRIQGVPTVPYDEYNYKIVPFKSAEYNSKDDLALLYPLQDIKGYRMDRGQQGEECNIIEYDFKTYTAYLGGDHSVWRKYVTGFATGRRALVVGDSFSNAFTPYLAPYYDEVHKVDARYYEAAKNGGTMGELIRKYGIDDVYVIVSYANGIASQTSMDKLEIALYGNT